MSNKIFHLQKKEKLLAVSLLLVILVSIVLELIPPLILEDLVNRLVNGQELVILAAFIYFGVLVLSGLFEFAKQIMITVFGQKITHKVRSALCRKLTRLPASYFTKNESGAITSRFVNDVDTVETLFTNGIIGMFADVCKVVGMIAVIFTKSLGLGILLIIAAPLILGLTRLFQKKMLHAQKRNRVAISRVNQYIPETIQNIRTIHNLEKEDYMEQAYDQKIQDSYRAVEKSNLYDSVYSPIIIMISTIIIAIVMILSAMGQMTQTFFGMSVGTAVAVISYVGRVFEPIENIGMEIQNIQSAIAGITRIREFLKEEEWTEEDPSLTMQALLGDKKEGIKLSNVTFSYDGSQQIIEQLTLSIEDGEIVTLAGRTGAGKSTIFKLPLGLYVPSHGTVTIYGKEAGKIPASLKRKLFGYVEQSFHQVPGTVAEQISLYDPSISMGEIQNATILVGMHEMICSLPKGYETDCRQVGFSQGQLQLLSIARAVVANPPIMLLDEITASLDSITELQILRALEKAANGRTVISISHRLYENLGSRMITI